MSELVRLVMNLGISYALMNREEFTEKFAALFEKYDWDEDKVKASADLFFKELEHWQIKKQTEHAFKKAQEAGNESVLEQLKELKEEIFKLNQEIQQFKKT